MRTELFWPLAFCGFAAVSLVCGIVAWPPLSAAWPSIEEKIDQFRRQPPFVKLLLMLFVGAFVVFGSTKPNGVDLASGTNIVEIVEDGTNDIAEIDFEGEANAVDIADGDVTNTPPMMLMTAMPVSGDQPQTVTPEDIARGWQLWEVRTNCTITYAMPEGATLATNWWVRGAYEDVKPIDFGSWRFPFGTNEYDSLWAFSWGKARFALGDAETEIVVVGAPMSAVPYRSRLWSAVDTNGARVVTWENFVLGRASVADYQPPSTNYQLVSAQIELRSTGDFIARSNEVEKVYHFIDDFDWDGDGIVNEDDWDPYWYDGDFTGQEPWWRGYVDETVGVGLTNGYYKLTAIVSDRDFERRVITVGDERVVVAEPGEYVFLLEKGVDYKIDVYPFSSEVSFEAVDDLPLVPRMFGMLGGRWWHWTSWSIEEGRLTLRHPTLGQSGFCSWLPTFQVTPSANHLGPGDSPQTFTAVLTDYAYGQSVLYSWWTDDSNISFGSPDSESTTIEVASMPMWGETEIVAMATIGTNELRSVCHFTYGVDPTPLVHIDIEAPSALLLNSNCVDSTKIGQVYVWFTPDVETNGTLSLVCLSGNDKIRLSGETSLRVTGSDSLCVEIEGIKASDALDDVSLVARFEPDSSSGVKDEGRALTVVQVNDVVLPGAPDDGLVISTGTSVALDMEVVPSTAKGRLSTSYYVRRLRGNGTYTDWNYAAGNYEGTAAVYNPSAGGIYQVQALVGVGWGAEDERYFRWEEDENREVGFGTKGELKSFGVVSEEWQKSLRNCALRHLGSLAYLNEVFLPAQYGFPEYPAGDLMFKCNIFVAHRIVESGLYVPATRGGVDFPGTSGLFRRYPPLANDWANESYFIRGWEVDHSFPEPGFVVADPDDEMGHVGIMDFDGYGISAGNDNVNRKFEAWVPGTVKRKYTGEN